LFRYIVVVVVVVLFIVVVEWGGYGWHVQSSEWDLCSWSSNANVSSSCWDVVLVVVVVVFFVVVVVIVVVL